MTILSLVTVLYKSSYFGGGIGGIGAISVSYAGAGMNLDRARLSRESRLTLIRPLSVAFCK